MKLSRDAEEVYIIAEKFRVTGNPSLFLTECIERALEIWLERNPGSEVRAEQLREEFAAIFSPKPIPERVRHLLRTGACICPEP